MLNHFPFAAPSLIGLDIQPDAIRLVQLKKRRHGFLVESIIAVNLPGEVFAEGKIKRWDILQSLLIEVIDLYRLHGLPAAINIPSHLVRMQSIQLPVGLTDIEIEMEIDAQMRRDLPGMLDTLCIDFTVMPQKDSGYMDVFFAAARHEYLAQYVECINASGLNVKVVDVDIYALQRAVSFDLQNLATPPGTHAILYLTHTHASLIVFNAFDILFHQHWDISEMPGLLKRNIELYLASNRITIQKLVLGGAYECIARMSEDASQRWAVPVHYPNPFTQMKLTTHVDTSFLSQASGFLIACGLAMREVSKW